MQVKLVAVSSPRVEGLNSAEDLISYCARVSNPDNQLNTETAPKLLKYCLDHGHVSIFEQVSATLEIETSRAIAAQILRHRSFSFQEFSQRYATKLEFQTHDARKQAEKNRQSSLDACDESDQAWFDEAQENVQRIASTFYELAIERGIAREQARMLLPLATTTRLYMTGSLRSWIHYVELRTKLDTQQEHREVAEAAKKLLAAEFPTVAEALGWV